MRTGGKNAGPGLSTSLPHCRDLGKGTASPPQSEVGLLTLEALREIEAQRGICTSLRPHSRATPQGPNCPVCCSPNPPRPPTLLSLLGGSESPGPTAHWGPGPPAPSSGGRGKGVPTGGPLSPGSAPASWGLLLLSLCHCAFLSPEEATGQGCLKHRGALLHGKSPEWELGYLDSHPGSASDLLCDLGPVPCLF